MIPFDASGAFRPRVGSHDLRRLAVRGAAATVSASGLALAAQVISTVILARLLTPADFGVVTMVTTFSLLLVSFGINGFSEAVIQFEEVDHQTASNLFWINIAAGLVLAIAFAASGSLLARFYGNPLVANVAIGMSVGIFISAASVIHLALLKRAILFTETSTNDIVGRVVNTAVSILLALRGWGYWALVAGIVAQQVSHDDRSLVVLPMGSQFAKANWQDRCHGPLRGKVYGNFIVAYSGQNIDNLLVGWRFNAVALGFYKKAFDLFALTASQLTAPLNNVALATLSRLNEDHVLLRRYLASSLGMVAFAGMAASADLTLVGKDVVRLVLGPRWAESGRIFQIFAPGIGAMLLMQHHWLGPSFRRETGALVTLEYHSVSSNRLLVSGGAALGTRGSRRGVECFVLDPPDSRLLVCWSTNRVWYLSFDFRHLEIRCRSAGCGSSNCRDHPGQATFGYCFRHQRCARGHRPYFNSVFRFIFGDGHPVSWRLGANAPACQSFARVGPVTKGTKPADECVGG